ncbi:MAG: DUF2970 domain-containing protein [Ideonella sp.]|nr:DUF2970 domain-containing protein [Ideonella sp.]
MTLAKRDRPSVLRYLQAVLWSFFGIRRHAGARADMAELRPLPLIVTGLVLAAVLVGVLLVAARAASGGLAA